MEECRHEWYAIETGLTEEQIEDYMLLFKISHTKKGDAPKYDKMCVKCFEADRSNSDTIRRQLDEYAEAIKEDKIKWENNAAKQDIFNHQMKIIELERGIKFLNSDKGYTNLTALEETQAALKRTYG